MRPLRLRACLSALAALAALAGIPRAAESTAVPADGGPDTLNALVPAPAADTASAAAPRPVSRPDRAALRHARLESRLERRAAARALRDSARRADNFYVGAGFATTETSVYAGSDSEVTEQAGPLALWFGYRTHFLPMIGMRTGGFLHFGTTEADRDVRGSSGWYGYQSHGSAGMTWEIDAQAQAIFGPFGRFTLEPGVFYGFGWHTADSIGFGDAGAGTYAPRPRFSVAGGMLGASLFFGSQDQFCPTGFLALSKMLGSADAMSFTAGIGFTVAFRDR